MVLQYLAIGNTLDLPKKRRSGCRGTIPPMESGYQDTGSHYLPQKKAPHGFLVTMALKDAGYPVIGTNQSGEILS